MAAGIIPVVMAVSLAKVGAGSVSESPSKLGVPSTLMVKDRELESPAATSWQWRRFWYKFAR